MRRHTAFAAGSSLVARLAAGCLESLRREDACRELVVDPPERVTIPPQVTRHEGYETAFLEAETTRITLEEQNDSSAGADYDQPAS
ncbi:hypothetical protein D8Y22_20580 [Salinadaptatus halalkaliphilus]|uniref:DUF7350 domain-containing protein n=1 Tax=Salinadaptatus halalkaliphilus TaxID=2419781 RepID=A0A4S3TJU7_9EURY|nr:hypothetical protein [Salinadaptatus halalkaliphilus]THE62858.1 hypothetical protein D8Y22_20580 [Salinadaptatus halalkaliphilus]